MKRKRKEKRRKVRAIRLWSLPEARKAIPYLRSVTNSVRDHWLAVQGKRLEVNRLARRPGRPDRSALLAGETAAEEESLAEDRFTDALNELIGIDVYLYDPMGGVAFIPFQKEEELAWFVFDLHDSDDVKTWRFHQDPLEMRRPIAEALGETKVNPEVN
jgi:hypothetical protein